MRPKAKYAVIHRHRGEYPISVMCKFFGVSRSGYYCFKKRLGETDRDAVVAKEIEECQRRTDKTYGYRRVWKWLKGRNIQRDPKTVLRIMKKYGLLSEVRRRRQWVNPVSYTHLDDIPVRICRDLCGGRHRKRRPRDGAAGGGGRHGTFGSRCRPVRGLNRRET